MQGGGGPTTTALGAALLALLCIGVKHNGGCFVIDRCAALLWSDAAVHLRDNYSLRKSTRHLSWMYIICVSYEQDYNTRSCRRSIRILVVLIVNTRVTNKHIRCEVFNDCYYYDAHVPYC